MHAQKSTRRSESGSKVSHQIEMWCAKAFVLAKKNPTKTQQKTLVGFSKGYRNDLISSHSHTLTLTHTEDAHKIYQCFSLRRRLSAGRRWKSPWVKRIDGCGQRVTADPREVTPKIRPPGSESKRDRRFVWRKRGLWTEKHPTASYVIIHEAKTSRQLWADAWCNSWRRLLGLHLEVRSTESSQSCFSPAANR